MEQHEQIQNLVELYYKEMKHARYFKKTNQMELHDQCLNQSFGIINSAKALGIDEKEFKDAYENYREQRIKEQKQKRQKQVQ